MSTVMNKVGFKSTPFLFAIAVTLHNLEEYFFMPEWALKHSPLQIPELIGRFPVAVTIVTLVFWVVAFIGWRAQKNSLGIMCFAGTVAVMSLNVFFPHLLASVATLSYNPGLASGLLLILPTGALTIHKGLEEGYFSKRQLAQSTLAMLVFYLLLLGVVFFV